MPSIINLKAKGLTTSPNPLDDEPGGLNLASNIIIRRDNVIEPRRGFKLYGESFGSSSDRLNQLTEYRQRILRHYNSTLQFQNGINNDGTVNFTDFSGSFSETEEGLRIKFIDSNGNLYFTTSDGIKKISATDTTQFLNTPGFITQAGGIKAVDLTGSLVIELGNQTGFLPADSAVAYRIVWGIKDANSNLILGSPSQRFEIYNPLLPLILQDFVRVLGALDDINQSGSLITDGDYVNSLKLPITATANELQTNLIALASKIDNDILYADNDGAPTGAPLELDTATISSGTCTITFASGDPSTFFNTGSKIFLTGFSPTTGTLDGSQIVVSVSATDLTFNTSATGPVTIDPSATIVSNEYRSITQPAEPSLPATHQELQDLQDYLLAIITRLREEPNATISTGLLTQYITPLDVTTTVNVQLIITIPEGVTTSHFYQVYRSSIAQATGSTVLTDLTPNDELQLVFEEFPTQAQIDSGQVIVEDITPDGFRGANLYTNAATGEGILQANDIPPFAKDINRFKNSIFYANTRTRHRKTLSLLGVSNMIDDFNNSIIPKITISDGSTNNTYNFVTGISEQTDITCTSGATLVATASPASYFTINSANNKHKYYVWYKVSLSTDPAIAGRTGIQVTADAGDTATQIAEKTRDTLSRYLQDFIVESATTTVTVTNTEVGFTDDADQGTTSFTITVIDDGRGELITQEISEFTCVADVGGSLAGLYFTINTAYNKDQYYVWYEVSGSGSDPSIAGKTGIKVELITNDSASVVAQKTMDELNALSNKFIASSNSSILTIKNYSYGAANDSTVGTSTFTLNITQQGATDVLLSTQVSVGKAVDETARSLTRVINTNTTDSVYAYYLSGAQDVPGKMLLEYRELSDTQFYLLANNSTTGASFNPDLSPENTITSISTGSPSTMLITTTNPHGMLNGDYVMITNTNSTPIIDGLYPIIYVSSTTFRINVTITTAGTNGAIKKATTAEVSENEIKQNRIYYSKTDQPEAVPIVNYFDVGSSDKSILRIFPLRDSLFVFKEDGLYRISGESPPFVLALFDSSCILIAPDSVSVANNLVFAWTTQGISTISESGVTIISRVIDDQILKIGSSSYSNFSTATWGIGYESDNSYLVWTTRERTDTLGTICYRYSTLTDTWTNYDKSNTCGIVNPVDGKLYLGAGDTNFLEQERKEFNRYDYSDREYTKNLTENNYFNNRIKLADISNIEKGDVITQDQLLTVYEFNALLEKLDTDGGINDTNYFSLLQMVGGDDSRQKIVDLATKLDLDTGVSDTDYASTIASKTGAISTISVANPTIITSAGHGLKTGRIVTISGTDSLPVIDGVYEVTVIDVNTFSIPVSVTSPGTTGSFATINSDFRDIKACYNTIISKLNLDPQVYYSNYSMIDTTTIQESVVLSVNKISKEITLNLTLDYLIGPLTVFKAINSSYSYEAITMGDVLGIKHVREATIIFDNKAFTNATLSFSTDLLPQFVDVDFNGDGSGIFGHQSFGSNFFGGGSHSAPFRTYIPRKCQRCRYIFCKFTHKVARETFAIYGITLTAEVGLSTRGYR